MSNYARNHAAIFCVAILPSWFQVGTSQVRVNESQRHESRFEHDESRRQKNGFLQAKRGRFR